MFKQVRKFIQRQSKKVKIGIPLVVLVLFFILSSFFRDNTPSTVVEAQAPLVELAASGSLAANMTNTFTGTVVSSQQATLRTQSQGQIIGIYRNRGDRVSRGTLIAQIENGREEASVAQARATLSVAQANLAKLSNESAAGRSNALSLAVEEAERNLSDTRAKVILDTQTIYSNIDAAILSYVDSLFDSPRGPNPWFTYAPELRSGNTREKLNRERKQVTYDLINWRKDLQAAQTAEEKIAVTKNYLIKIRPLFDTLVLASTDLETSDRLTTSGIATIKNSATTARSVLLNALSEIQSLENTLASQERSLTSARNNEQIGVIGAQDEDIIIAEAQVEQAQAGLQAALVAYENTLIRSPINGTITALTIEVGDVTSPLQEVGSVSNTGSLEISVFVNEEDAKRLRLRTVALINGSIEGYIQEIAPTLDPITQKREVIISSSSSQPFTQGEVVSVRLEDISNTSSSDLFIPLNALKITPTQTVVFTVEDSVLIALPVTIDSISGEYARIKEGINADTLIVTDARGRRAGETVRTN